MQTFIRRIISSLVFLNIAKRYEGRSALMKIKAAQFYVRGVKKVRIFFLGILFVICSFLLLGGGLILVHMALFTYSGWAIEMKFLAALVLGSLEVFIASGILVYLFREETWVKFWGIEHVLESVVKKEDASLASTISSGQDK